MHTKKFISPRIRLTLLFLFLLFKVNSQIPLHKAFFSSQIAEDLQSEKIRWIRAAWRHTYIGAYEEAIIAYKDKNEMRWGFDTLALEGLEDFLTYEPRDAREVILKEATKHKVMIINEAHHIPMHRHFVKQLLKNLFEQGYRYFGIEALNNCEIMSLDPTVKPCYKLLNDRGYPLNSPIEGTYIREPRMANLIREAIKIGFTVFPYEQFGGNRELDQAKNIQKVMSQHPDDKFLILCGFGHLIEAIDEETTYADGKIMAYHLKQLTGYDPLTINQYVLTEANDSLEAPLYKRINLPEISVFRNNKGEYFNGFPRHDKFDMLVYHPRTQYVFKRPTWLLNDESLDVVKIEKNAITIDYPILIQARYKTDDPMAVPVDTIELKNPEDETVLLLPKGAFVLEIHNLEGEHQQIFINNN